MGYQLIETIEVGAGGAASIEFTGIPQDATSLVLKLSLRMTDVYNYQAKLRFNNDSGTNYNYRVLNNNGTSVQTSAGVNRTDLEIGVPDNNAFTANTFGSLSVIIANYNSSSAKSISADSVLENNGYNQMYLTAGNWNNSAAINSLKIYETQGSSWVQYSTASLYKITAD